MWYKGQKVKIISDHCNSAATRFIGQVGIIADPLWGYNHAYNNEKHPYACVRFPYNQETWSPGIFYQNMAPVDDKKNWFYEEV